MTHDYGETLARTLSSSTAWSKPHVESFSGRVLMALALGEAIRAALAVRERGAVIELNEWASEDRIDLKAANGREVSIGRRARSNVPLLPGESSAETITAPVDEVSAKATAVLLIDSAIRQLFRSA